MYRTWVHVQQVRSGSNLFKKVLKVVANWLASLSLGTNFGLNHSQERNLPHARIFGCRGTMKDSLLLGRVILKKPEAMLDGRYGKLNRTVTFFIHGTFDIGDNDYSNP